MGISALPDEQQRQQAQGVERPPALAVLLEAVELHAGEELAEIDRPGFIGVQHPDAPVRLDEVGVEITEAALKPVAIVFPDRERPPTDLDDGRRLTHWRQSVPVSPWLYALGVARFASGEVRLLADEVGRLHLRPGQPGLERVVLALQLGAHEAIALLESPRGAVDAGTHGAEVDVATRGYGAALAAGADSLKIHGRYYGVKAEVEKVDLFSAHADQEGLLTWLGQPAEIVPIAAGYAHICIPSVIAYFLFMILVVSGVLLTFYYRPSVEEAYPSIQFIVSEAPFGWLLRDMHVWAASLIVVALLAHMTRILFAGAYKSPRETSWFVGIALGLRRSNRAHLPDLLLSVYIVLAYFAFASGYYMWWGGWACGTRRTSSPTGSTGRPDCRVGSGRTWSTRST